MKTLKLSILVVAAIALSLPRAKAFQMFENAVRTGTTTSQDGAGVIKFTIEDQGGAYVPPFQIRRDSNGQPACYMTVQLENGIVRPADPSWCQ